MKIFSNFDTKLERTLLQELGEMFGADKVMILHKTRRYLYYHVRLPYLFLLGVGAVAMYFLYGYSGVSSPVIAQRLVFIVLAILCIHVVHHTVVYYMNYKMDFLVVTPKEVMKYDQEGVWHRSVEKLSTKHLKSVTISKEGFLASFLDIGNICFLVEGEDARGMLMIEYVDAVEKKEKVIRHILGTDSLI